MKERIDRPSITVFGGRYIEERYFMITLVDLLAHCGIRGEDEPFGTRANGKMHLVLTARKVCDQITETCAKHGLLPAGFSSYSPCKGAICDMRALGSTVENR